MTDLCDASPSGAKKKHSKAKAAPRADPSQRESSLRSPDQAERPSQASQVASARKGTNTSELRQAVGSETPSQYLTPRSARDHGDRPSPRVKSPVKKRTASSDLRQAQRTTAQPTSSPRTDSDQAERQRSIRYSADTKQSPVGKGIDASLADSATTPAELETVHEASQEKQRSEAMEKRTTSNSLITKEQKSSKQTSIRKKVLSDFDSSNSIEVADGVLEGTCKRHLHALGDPSPEIALVISDEEYHLLDTKLPQDLQVNADIRFDFHREPCHLLVMQLKEKSGDTSPRNRLQSITSARAIAKQSLLSTPLNAKQSVTEPAQENRVNFPPAKVTFDSCAVEKAPTTGRFTEIETEILLAYEKAELTPALKLEVMLKTLQRNGLTTASGTVPWALNKYELNKALISTEGVGHFINWIQTTSASDQLKQVVRTILHLLRLFAHDEDSHVLCSIREHYGAGVAFTYAWHYYYVQQLWLMAFGCFIVCLAGIGPDSGCRILWEIAKMLVLFWGLAVAMYSSLRFQREQAKQNILRKATKGLGRQSTKRRSFIHTTRIAPRVRRWATFCLVAVPLFIAFIVVCFSTFFMVTTLILHIIYIWGRCLHRHTEENPCRDAEQEYHIFGWAAEVCCDILLAILFELFFALGNLTASWMASLVNFEYETDKLYFQGMLEVMLAALERIGFVGMLAFFFVPQYQSPSEMHAHGLVDVERTCDDLLFGSSDYRCFQRRLPLKTRRWVFQKLMKGPFIVAPFVALIIKVILPWVLHHITKWLHMNTVSARNSTAARVMCMPCRFVLRFSTCIFAYDGDNIGCCTYVGFGFPFTNFSEEDLAVVAAAESLKPYRSGLNSVLNQGMKKPFSARDEMLDLQMNFLWVVFFTPIMPVGVFATLGAKLIGINLNKVKMVFVRRRDWPLPDKVLRREMTAYTYAVVIAGFGWSVALSLVTYNDDIWKWSHWQQTIVILLLFAWLLLSASSAFTSWTMYGVAMTYERIAMLAVKLRHGAAPALHIFHPLPCEQQHLKCNTARGSTISASE